MLHAQESKIKSCALKSFWCMGTCIDSYHGRGTFKDGCAPCWCLLSFREIKSCYILHVSVDKLLAYLFFSYDVHVSGTRSIKSQSRCLSLLIMRSKCRSFDVYRKPLKQDSHQSRERDFVRVWWAETLFNRSLNKQTRNEARFGPSFLVFNANWLLWNYVKVCVCVYDVCVWKVVN